jgi:hypothetical protein
MWAQCETLRELLPFDCCGSCHTDEEQGYPAFMEETYKGVEYTLCCAGWTTIEEETNSGK